MTSPLSLHPPTTLLSAYLTTITKDIHPVSAVAVSKGSKLFGAAILRKSDLSLVIADTNQESGSPLWHGETWTIKKFFEIPEEERPDVKDCLFLTTHEPCSLCLSAITWSGFDNFTYLYTYEETSRLFQCHGDLDIFSAVFHRSSTHPTPAVATTSQPQIRPEYHLRNKYFVALSFAELVAAIEDAEERKGWGEKVEEVKRSYGSLSPDYRKAVGIEQ